MHDIFEKIISREIPSSIVYEDDVVLAFLDIRPITKGHTLIVPKKRFRNIFDGDPETLSHMMCIAQKIARAHREAFGTLGANILMNNEEIAGQEVFHAHLHVIPRDKEGQAFVPAQHVSYEEGEMDRYKENITTHLR